MYFTCTCTLHVPVPQKRRWVYSLFRFFGTSGGTVSTFFIPVLPENLEHFWLALGFFLVPGTFLPFLPGTFCKSLQISDRPESLWLFGICYSPVLRGWCTFNVHLLYASLVKCLRTCSHVAWWWCNHVSWPLTFDFRHFFINGIFRSAF